MPLRTTALYSFAVLLLLVTACKKSTTKEDNHRLFSEYFVRYLESDRQIKAYATFFEGDSLAKATSKTFLGGVSFQDSPMEARNIMDNAIRYTITQSGDYASSFEFEYKDDQRNENSHSVSMTPIKSFVLPPQIQKSEGLKLTVEGGHLGENESLVLLFNNEANKASSITISGPSQGIEHLIPADNLNGLTSGKCQLYLVKKKNEITESSDSYTVSSIEFYSNTVEVEVVE